MILIYADKKIKGLEGKYISPKGFSRGTRNATLVYTNDKKIKDNYTQMGIEVKPIKKEKNEND